MNFNASPLDNKAAKKRLICVAVLLVIFGTVFGLALLYGIQNADSAFQVRPAEYGRARAKGPALGLFGVLVCTGLATVWLAVDLARAWRDYKAALKTPR